MVPYKNKSPVSVLVYLQSQSEAALTMSFRDKIIIASVFLGFLSVTAGLPYYSYSYYHHAPVAAYYQQSPYYHYYHSPYYNYIPIVYKSKITYITPTTTTTPTTTPKTTTTSSSFSDLVSSLWSLLPDPSSVGRMADYVSCLSESIEGIITDVRDVVEKILRFAELSEPAEIVRESAVLLRLLEPLAGNDTANIPGSCGAAEGFQSMESLAMMASSITTFLTELRLTSARLAYLCTEDSLYNRDFITAIGDLMEELADLLAALGDVENGERIRYGKVYTDKVTVGVMIKYQTSNIKYQILSTQFRPNWRSWRRWTPMV